MIAWFVIYGFVLILFGGLEGDMFGREGCSMVIVTSHDRVGERSDGGSGLNSAQSWLLSSHLCPGGALAFFTMAVL